MLRSLISESLSFLKILGIGSGVLALFVFVVGALAIFLAEKFPNWTFNELVYPSKEVKHS